MPMYFHGGVIGLVVGSLIEPGHSRDNRHPGCEICEARAAGTTAVDRPSARHDQVYFTEDVEYARFHASLYGRGDLYRVEPVGVPELSAEDLFPSHTAPAARVVAVLARGVRLTPRQRTSLYVRWGRLQGRTKAQAHAELERMVQTLHGAQ
jgi:hypothetical protein